MSQWGITFFDVPKYFGGLPCGRGDSFAEADQKWISRNDSLLLSPSFCLLPAALLPVCYLMQTLANHDSRSDRLQCVLELETYSESWSSRHVWGSWQTLVWTQEHMGSKTTYNGEKGGERRIMWGCFSVPALQTLLENWLNQGIALYQVHNSLLWIALQQKRLLWVKIAFGLRAPKGKERCAHTQTQLLNIPSSKLPHFATTELKLSWLLLVDSC